MQTGRVCVVLRVSILLDGTLKKKSCELCGKPFRQTKGRKFCGQDCKRRSEEGNFF